MSRADVTSRLSVEMRYVGQGYEIEVPLTRADLEMLDHAQLIALFEDACQRRFGMRLPGVATEAINWRRAAVRAGRTASNLHLGNAFVRHR